MQPQQVAFGQQDMAAVQFAQQGRGNPYAQVGFYGGPAAVGSDEVTFSGSGAKEDGGFNPLRAVGSLVKGALSPITSMFSSVTGMLTGGALMAGGWFLAKKIPAAKVLLTAAGMLFGGYEGLQGLMGFASAKNNEERYAALEHVGSAAVALVPSMKFAKGAIAEAKTAAAAEAKIAKMSAEELTAFKNTQSGKFTAELNNVNQLKETANTALTGKKGAMDQALQTVKNMEQQVQTAKTTLASTPNDKSALQTIEAYNKNLTAYQTSLSEYEQAANVVKGHEGSIARIKQLQQNIADGVNPHEWALEQHEIDLLHREVAAIKGGPWAKIKAVFGVAPDAAKATWTQAGAPGAIIPESWMASAKSAMNNVSTTT